MNGRKVTYQLVQLNDALEPLRSACGCVVRYKHRLFLLTVAHAAKKGDWAISLQYVPGQGMQQQRLGALHFLTRLRLFRAFIKGSGLDFAYKPLDSAPPAVLQEITPTGVILGSEPKAIIDTDFNVLPDSNAQYGFWGTAYDAYEPNRFWLAPREELNLELTASRGDFLFFKRSSPYRSFADYRGCSGSPIMDDAGNLIALLQRGDRRNTGFWGFNLTKFKSAFDVETMRSASEYSSSGTNPKNILAVLQQLFRSRR